MTRPIVLLAEDDPDLSDLVAMMLEVDGVQVIAVGNGNDVLPALRLHHPDLVLLDLTLPGKDGVDVVRELREVTDVPVLIITGFGREQGVDQALAAGATDFLLKPFRPAELRNRVATLVHRVA